MGLTRLLTSIPRTTHWSLCLPHSSQIRQGVVWLFWHREGYRYSCMCVYGKKHHQMFSKSVQIMPQEIMAHPQDSTLIGDLPTLSP